ncbi:MAG: DHH family phosphoesterase [Candidatus Alcyoniella australis]|nr:DHH family phosphoesterase [Candidatus Alcyoniella australis]
MSLNQQTPAVKTKWDELCVLLAKHRPRRRLLIMTHNNPDPDAISAAAGLKYLVWRSMRIHSTIQYGGIISRAENVQMVKHCRIDIRTINPAQASRYSLVAIVDSQPGARNNSLSKKIKAQIAIDHHVPLRKETLRLPFHDVRNDHGSTCTIITGYFQHAGVEPDRRIATAMYYGILTDVGDIGRDKHAIDIRAMQWLHRFISERTLMKITHPRMSAAHLNSIADAIKQAVVYRDVIISDLGEVARPDTISELADFLLKLEGMRWSFTCGHYNGKIMFSMRTSQNNRNAGQLAYRLSKGRGDAGGHQRFAGGMITLNKNQLPHEQCSALIERFLKLIGRQDLPCRPISPLKPPEQE